MRAGIPFAELERWSYPKFRLRLKLVEQAMMHEAMLFSFAFNDPKKFQEQMRSGEEANEEWEPPSLDRLKKNMKTK